MHNWEEQVEKIKKYKKLYGGLIFAKISYGETVGRKN